MYTLLRSFVKIHLNMTKVSSFNEENPQFLRILSAMLNLLQANCLGFTETLQICTRWTNTNGAPCWKSKIISGEVRISRLSAHR